MELKYELRISEGSGYNGANWILFLTGFGPSWGSLCSFQTKEEAEECRSEMFRSLILQAAGMSPSSERR